MGTVKDPVPRDLHSLTAACGIHLKNLAEMVKMYNGHQSPDLIARIGAELRMLVVKRGCNKPLLLDVCAAWCFDPSIPENLLADYSPMFKGSAPFEHLLRLVKISLPIFISDKPEAFALDELIYEIANKSGGAHEDQVWPARLQLKLNHPIVQGQLLLVSSWTIDVWNKLVRHVGSLPNRGDIVCKHMIDSCEQLAANGKANIHCAIKLADVICANQGINAASSYYESAAELAPGNLYCISKIAKAQLAKDDYKAAIDTLSHIETPNVLRLPVEHLEFASACAAAGLLREAAFAIDGLINHIYATGSNNFPQEIPGKLRFIEMFYASKEMKHLSYAESHNLIKYINTK